YIKGGSAAFSTTIADIFVDNGGIIKYEEKVVELIFEGEKLCGAIVMDNENNNKTYYSHVIIANNNPLVLVSSLTPEDKFPKDYIENIKNREPSLSAVNLYLGLDIDIKEYDISDYMIWTPINRDNSVADLKKSLEITDYSKLPVGSITIYSNIDPSCCPDGKSVISVLCYAKFNSFESLLDPKDENNMKYNSIKLKIKEQLIELISKILNISDLKTHIEVSELATPITFRHFSDNPNGSIMGWQMNPEQFVFKPLVQKTPIENLYLVGQWVSRTGGLPSVAGCAEVVSKLAIEYLERRKNLNY
ncbi:MAG: phytoene desaturase family protein, partial [Candidatus Odinarchaeota archaeon]